MTPLPPEHTQTGRLLIGIQCPSSVAEATKIMKTISRRQA
jgi:hypothetical protein